MQAGWHHGGTRRKTERTDKDMRDNKGYILRDTNEGGEQEQVERGGKHTKEEVKSKT